MSRIELTGGCEQLDGGGLTQVAAGALMPAAAAARASARTRASVAEIELLYRERATAFTRFAGATLGDAELARDVVQDAFAQALRRRERFRGDGTLEAWLWRTVLNTTRNAARARSVRRRFASRAESERQELQPAFSEGALPDEHRALRAAVAALPERQRMCVFLRYFADLDYAAIAAALEISPGTVAATLNAARTSLRERLDDSAGATEAER